MLRVTLTMGEGREGGGNHTCFTIVTTATLVIDKISNLGSAYYSSTAKMGRRKKSGLVTWYVATVAVIRHREGPGPDLSRP